MKCVLLNSVRQLGSGGLFGVEMRLVVCLGMVSVIRVCAILVCSRDAVFVVISPRTVSELVGR